MFGIEALQESRFAVVQIVRADHYRLDCAAERDILAEVILQHFVERSVIVLLICPAIERREALQRGTAKNVAARAAIEIGQVLRPIARRAIFPGDVQAERDNAAS